MRLEEFGREMKRLIPKIAFITLDEYSIKLHSRKPEFKDSRGPGYWQSRDTITGIEMSFVNIDLREFTDNAGRVRYSRAIRELKDE